MITTSKLTELVNKYTTSPKDSLLEFRFKNITRDVFTDIYKSLIGEPASIVYEVDIISEDVYERGAFVCDDICYSRRLRFDGQTIVSDKYIHRVRLEKPIYVGSYIKCEAVIIQERESQKFTTSTSAEVNFNITTHFETPHWQISMRCTKKDTVMNMGGQLKALRKTLFLASAEPKNFLENANLELINSYNIIVSAKSRPANTSELDKIFQNMFSAANNQYLIDSVYQSEIYEIAKLIYEDKDYASYFKGHTYRLKKLANPVIAVSKESYYSEVYPPTGFLLTDKADGQRAIMSINGNRCRIIKSDSMDEKLKSGESTFVAGPITVCDAELIQGKNSEVTAYVFDVMVIDGKKISQNGIEERVLSIPRAVEILESLGIQARAKKYTVIDDIKKSIESVYNAKYPYELDGLILSRPGSPYATTQNYKWKPMSHNTIDFLAVKCPQKMLGITPYTKKAGMDIYLLFVGINHVMREKLGIGLIPEYKSLFDTAGAYYPVQFSPSSNPTAYIYYHKSGDDIDRKIVELSFGEDGWVFHRVREDRLLEKNYYGNDYATAEQIYSNFIDPFELEDLWKSPRGYFIKNADTIYEAANKYKRFVISNVFKNNFSRSKWIIDEAAGRGADLHRYESIGVQNTLFIDIDASAIAELIRRKLGSAMPSRRQPRQRTGGNPYSGMLVKDVRGMTVHTLVKDLTVPAADLEAATYQYGVTPGMVDGIVCNFALHYLCDSCEHIRNILRFNAQMLKVGGVFFFTVMDGKKVFELLKDIPTGSQWETREGPKIKYAIKKLYKSDKLTPVGQKIAVKLPFADEMYEEPLCNVEMVIAEAAKLNMEVELNQPMDDMLGQFADANRGVHGNLTDDDKKYIGLHKYVSLRKIK